MDGSPEGSILRDKSAEEKLHETIDPEDISTIAAGIKGDGTKKWGSMMGKAAVDGSYLKFTASLQAPDLKAKLLETGDRTLVKASPCDRFSGIGYGESIALSKQQFWGGNIMGKALMEVRRRLVEEAQPLPGATSRPATYNFDIEIMSTEDDWEDTPAPTADELDSSSMDKLTGLCAAVEQLSKRMDAMEVAKVA